MVAAAVAFAKTICSICYEDLKPIVEDLQYISICGHVFHELCLQQWFEYCKNGKKKNCPVCKQSCSDANVGRLYFQSIGDPNDQNVTQKSSSSEENSEELRNEITRLEGKVSRLSSVLDQQQKSLEASSSELLVVKEQLKLEESQKKEALNQKANFQRLIHLKSEELDKSTLECMRLQNKNMALAKELAALKLVSDLDLVEDEVLKLACLGNEVNSKETVDVLKKSLVIRNKSYKELMTKCNMIGRGEARSLAELKKAQEKIKKLKERVEELESLIEARDNEALRMLKPSGAATNSMKALNNSFQKHIATGVSTFADQNKAPSLETNLGTEEDYDFASYLKKKRKPESSRLTSVAGAMEVMVAKKFAQDKEKNCSLVDEDGNMRKTSTPTSSHRHFKPLTENGVDFREHNSRTGDQESDPHLRQHNEDKISDVKAANPSETEKKAIILDDDIMVIDIDTAFSQPVVKVTKETPSPVSHPGHRSFAAGLLGPDGTKWHLGKWCKKVHNKGQASLTMGLQGSNASSGDLIAVGADGRGGTVKVLRSLTQSSLVNRETQTSTTTNQIGTKSSSSLKSHGFRQIDQFFGRATQTQKF